MGALYKYARHEVYDFALPVIAMGILLALARGEDNPEGWAGIHGHSAYKAAIYSNIVDGLLEGEMWLGPLTVFDVPVKLSRELVSLEMVKKNETGCRQRPLGSGRG